MKHAQFEYDRFLHPPARAEPLARCALYAAFGDRHCEQSAPAYGLLHILGQAGIAVHGLGFGAGAIGDVVLSTAGRRAFRASLATLGGLTPDRAVLMSDAFDFARIDRSGWLGRRWEELRALRLIWAALTTARRTDVILARGWIWRRADWCVLALGLLARARLRRSATATTLAARMLRRPVDPASDAAIAETAAALIARSAGQVAPARISPSQMERALRHALSTGGLRTGEAAQLRLLSDAARLIDAQAHPVLRLCRNTPVDGPAPPADPGGLRGLDIDPALRRATGVPITGYMLHLRRVFRMEDDFPLRDRASARRFLHWYLVNLPRLLPQGWVPVLPAQRAAYLGCEPAPPAPSWPASGQPTAAGIAAAVEALLRGGTPCPRAMAFLGGPATNDARAAPRVAFVLAMVAKLGLDARPERPMPWADPRLRCWAARLGASVLPSLAACVEPERVPARRDRELHLVGLIGSATGIGGNLRMSARALTGLGLTAKVSDAESRRRVEAPATAPPRRLNRDFVLHHVNAERIPQSMLSPHLADRRDAVHAGFLLWEFDRLPPQHQLALQMLDEIWAPSRFVAETYRAHSAVPVRMIGKAVEPGVPVLPDLGAMGIPGDAFVFLTCFDFHSSVARKNPLAAVEAFRAAFPARRRDVVMVVKSTPSEARHWGDPEDQFGAIRRIARADRRIILIEAFLEEPQLHGLIRAADALVSPHRAEGFGLIPAKAMALGTPVIATDYSGTRDFCRPDTAALLPARMVAPDPAHLIHPLDGARWAEVDRDALIAAMRCAVEKPGEAQRRALNGRRLMADEYSNRAQMRRYREALAALSVI